MKTALICHPIYMRHDTGPHHPERPSRLQSIFRGLQKSGLIKKLAVVEPKAAPLEDIALVHAEDYISGIRDRCSRIEPDGTVALDADTIISKDSYEAAVFAAGGVIKAADLVAGGEADNGFCMVRPPGHHAGISQAMGFCIFNNIAIGARYIRKSYKVKRVLIIDWDAHHGNGTEEIFYRDPSVFYISLHQYPHYPGTGSGKSAGEGKGKGFNLNIPMSAGSGDEDYIKAFKEVIVPAIKKFRPEFILISAGFDSHKDDPLSSLNLTENGYSEMTDILKEQAELYCQKRIISVLEGGYNLLSLANSVHSHLKALSA